MKTLSLKLDDHVFEETEEVVAELNLARNRYINGALTLYNQFNKRRSLKRKLSKESRLVWLMKFKQFDIWLTDLNPTVGTEPGKTRPVVIIQTNLLNETHLSTIICPITTNINPEAEILRIHLKKTITKTA